MDNNMHDVLDYLGITGLLALIGGAVGYGQLHGRVKSLEDKDVSQENAVAIARLEAKVDMLLSAQGLGGKNA